MGWRCWGDVFGLVMLVDWCSLVSHLGVVGLLLLCWCFWGAVDVLLYLGFGFGVLLVYQCIWDAVFGCAIAVLVFLGSCCCISVFGVQFLGCHSCMGVFGAHVAFPCLVHLWPHSPAPGRAGRDQP